MKNKCEVCNKKGYKSFYDNVGGMYDMPRMI